MDELTSKTISWLRFVLVMMVLLYHVHPDGNPNFLGTDVSRLADGTVGQVVYTVAALAMFVVCNLSVPLFFFISGYLFYTSSREWNWRDVWWSKMKRRVYTLLIPYLAYNLLSAANGYIMSAVDPSFAVSWSNPAALPFIGEFWNSTTACAGMTNILGFSMQLYYPADIPLWFVRDLMLTVAVSPVIYGLICRCAVCWLGTLGVLFVCGVGATLLGLNTYALLFFSLGACFRIKEVDLLGFVRRWRWVWLVVGVVLLALSVVWYARPFAQQFQHLFFVVGIFGLVFLGASLLEKGRCRVHPLLVRSSFFVFAAHMMPIGYSSLLSLGGEVAHWLLPMEHVAVAPFGYVFAACFIAAIGVLLYKGMERLAPWMLKVLSGGR